MARPDPAISFLKDIGFLPIRLPRADVQPLQLVSRNGKDLNVLGELKNAMVANGALLPSIVSDIHSAALIQGQQSSRIKLSVGLSILGNILQAMTGNHLDVSVGYQKARTVSFQFTNVTVDRTDIVLLDQFLNRADIHPASRHIEDLMIDDQVGVITATVRSNRFVVAAQGDGGVDVSVDVPLLQGVAGGTVKVSAANAAHTSVAYEGSVPVAFGVQVVRLFFDDNGNYTAFDPIKAGEAAVRSLGRAAASTPVLFTVEGPFARFGR